MKSVLEANKDFENASFGGQKTYQFFMNEAQNVDYSIVSGYDDEIKKAFGAAIESVEEYLQAFESWAERFSQLLAHEFDDYPNKQKIRDAVVYIHENYMSQINMAAVSNEVSMNYSLFSLLFK